MQLVEETIHHLFGSLGYVWFLSYELYCYYEVLFNVQK